ncbi:MAG TPA: VOC family protein [Rhodopila sp.]
MLVQPYLMFEGRCDEALKFYQTAVGAELLMLMRYKEAPDPSMVTPETAEKVMHASFRIGDSVLMASDGHCTGQPGFSGISLTISAPDDTEAERIFTALADGGQVTMPLAKTFFASKFGMTADRFGVRWMVLAGQQA